MISKLAEVSDKAKKFKSTDGSVFTAFIANVGFKLDKRYLGQLNIMKARNADDDMYALTTEGEPICLNRYGHQIASHPHSHCFIFEDFLGDMLNKINGGFGSIHPEAQGKAGFQELSIEDKSSLNKLYFFYSCNIDKLDEFFRTKRLVDNVSAFLLPHQLVTKILMRKFPDVSDLVQIVLDLRSDEHRADDNANRARVTLNQDMRVIKDMPKLLSHESTPQYGMFPSVHLLEKQGIILHVRGHSNDLDKIVFALFNANNPHDPFNVVLDRHHYRAGMTANNTQKEDYIDTNTFIATIFAIDENEQPALLLKFDKVGKLWSDSPK